MKEQVEKLKARGYKITNQRRAILAVFIEEERHLLTAAEVYEAVTQKETSMNFSTVYRNLEVLTEAAIIKRHNLDNGINYYELETNEHHHHLICLGCGQTKTIFSVPLSY
ncbi:Fur family transcriptional regulator [Alkaliphilus crotonatoxidans]